MPSIKKELPPQELLNELLTYDPTTGVLTWKFRQEHHFNDPTKVKSWNSRYGLLDAGYVSTKDNYIYVEIYKSTFVAHRLIWKLVHNESPDEIDHINGVRNDNRLINLRNVTHSENSKNITALSNNTSGRIGIYWNRRISMWCAQIKVDGATIPLGSYLAKEQAIQARKDAEQKHNFHPNHGKQKTCQLHS